MNLYEIDNAITNLIDPETGEILDIEAFRALNLERDRKIEGMALWVKDLTAEAKAIREEELILQARRKAAERKAESLKRYLTELLEGSKFKTPKVSISYRNSTALEIADEVNMVCLLEELDRCEFLKYDLPTVNKTLLKTAIEAGEVFEGAELVTRCNIQIK